MAKNSPEENQSNQRQTSTSVRPGGLGRGGLGMGMPVVKAQNPKQTLKRLWHYMIQEAKTLAVVFALVVVGTVLMLTGPYFIGVAIDRYITPGDFPGLLRLSALMLSIFVVSALCTWLQNYYMIGLSQKIIAQMRKDLFAKLHTLPLRFFDSKPHGELMSRLTNDIENISNTLNSSTTQVFASIIAIMGAFAMMIYLSPLLTIFSLFTIPIMIVATKKIAKGTRTYFAAQQKNLGDLNGLIEETISGQRVVKVFCREETLIRQFNQDNLKLKEAGIKAQIYSGIIMPFMNVLNNLSFAILAGFGGWLVIQGAITVGVIASFISYSRQFTRPVNELANQFNMVQSAIAGAERFFEIMDEAPETKDAPNAVALKEIGGNVDFTDVSFSYMLDTPVLKHVDLHVTSGQTIALVGPTGAGKTTIINLLTRFYEINQGSITIDGKNIQDIARNNLRQLLGIVLQDTFLFSESVRENIRYGKLEATDEQVEAAAKLANADTFIRRLPEGYDTVLTEDGGNLSQGQRQLIAIARALLADPAILILDEATSSVDTRTEIHIQEAMLHLMQGRTSFVIAHRLSTVRDADTIVVINDGEIIEQGTHEELLAQQGFYHQLYINQFSRQTA